MTSNLPVVGSRRRGLALLAVLAVSVVMVAACSTPEADEASEGGSITIEDAWVRPAGAGANTAAYMRIVSGGSDADRLLGAGTDVAEMVQVHETVWDGDVASMQHLEDGLEIPAGGEVVLEPGSYHVMIMGLQDDLAAGDTLAVTLMFEGAGDMVVDAPVRTMDMEEGMSGHDG